METNKKKSGGNQFEDLLQCVRDLKALGATQVKVSNETIECIFPPSFHVEQNKSKSIDQPKESVLGYDPDVLFHSS